MPLVLYSKIDQAGAFFKTYPMINYGKDNQY